MSDHDFNVCRKNTYYFFLALKLLSFSKVLQNFVALPHQNKREAELISDKNVKHHEILWFAKEFLKNVILM